MAGTTPAIHKGPPSCPARSLNVKHCDAKSQGLLAGSKRSWRSRGRSHASGRPSSMASPVCSDRGPARARSGAGPRAGCGSTRSGNTEYPHHVDQGNTRSERSRTCTWVWESSISCRRPPGGRRRRSVRTPHQPSRRDAAGWMRRVDASQRSTRSNTAHFKYVPFASLVRLVGAPTLGAWNGSVD